MKKSIQLSDGEIIEWEEADAQKEVKFPSDSQSPLVLRAESYLEYYKERAGLQPGATAIKSITITRSQEVQEGPEGWHRVGNIKEGVFIVDENGKEISVEELDQEIREANAKRLKNNDTTN